MRTVIVFLSFLAVAGAAFSMEATEVAELVRDLEAAGLPDQLPPNVAKHLSMDEEAEYDPKDWMLGFFIPEILKSEQRELYRRTRRFWRLAEKKKIALVPSLVDEMLAAEADGAVGSVDGLAQIITEILEDGFGVAGYEEALHVALPRILDSDAGTVTRRRFLEDFTGELVRKNTDSALVLVDLATGRDRDNDPMRASLLGALSAIRPDLADPSIRTLLLQSAQTDPSVECRIFAARGLPKLFPTEEWEPILLRVLHDALTVDHPDLILLIRELAFSRQQVKSAPLMIRALLSENPRIQSAGVSALERLFEPIGEDLGYDSLRAKMLFAPEQHRAAVEQERELAIAAWREWWRANCHDLDGGCEVSLPPARS